jgi:assimilatory nitrate reductase catalytic subunit
VTPPCCPNWRLGTQSAILAEPSVVAEEFRRASSGGPADYAGVTWERIAGADGLFWPCPTIDHPGTPRLFLDRFATPDGRARFHPVDHYGPAEQTDVEFPMILTTGRLLVHYQSGTQTRRIASLTEAEPAPFVEIHPDTASAMKISDGALARLTTRRGTAVMQARHSRDIRRDTLFVPFHWIGANLLTNAALDPVSRIPEFKVCSVRIEPNSATPAT